MQRYKFLKYSLLIVFTLYWICSILANAPNCFIRIETLKYSKKFKEIFAQRWNFFAPPPNYNPRLTYEYYDISGSDTIKLSSLEVMESISKAKQAKRPFNAREEVLDYSVNSAFIDFLDYRSKSIQLAKINHPDADAETTWQTAKDYIHNHFFLNYSSSVLYNYGVRIAEEKNYAPDKTLMKINASRIFITKFADRNKEEKDSPVLEMLYESRYHNLNSEILNPLQYAEKQLSKLN